MKMPSLLVVATLVAFTTTGCTTSVVKSDTNGTSAGVAYYLPMRLAKLDATRKAAPADLAATIAKAEADKKLAEEASKSALPKIKELIEQVEQTNKAAQPNREAVTAWERQIAAQGKIMADKVVEAQNLDAQIKALKELQALQTKNPGERAFLYELKIALEDPIPDTSQKYVATLNKGAFRDDKLKIETTSAGLLTSSNATVTGREGDILVELAGAVGAFTFGGGLGSTASAAIPLQLEKLSVNQEPQVNPYGKCLPLNIGDGPNDNLEFRFNPLIYEAVISLNCALWKNGFPFAIVVSNIYEQSYEDANISNLVITNNIPSILKPLPKESSNDGANGMESSSSEGNRAIQAAEASAKSAAKSAELAEAAAWRASDAADRAERALSGNNGPRNDNANDGLFYRRPAPRLVTVNQLKPASDAPDKLIQYPMQSALLLLPQAGEIGTVPITARGFTRTVNDVTFENGMLTKWDTDQPSAVFEVVRLPVRMLEALFRIPANLIQLKFDVSSKSKSLAEVQAAQIKADAELTKLKACIETAVTAEAALDTCFKP